MIAAHATQWPNTEKSIMEFLDKKKEREDAINIQNAYQKWNCPLDFNCVLSFCHCEKHFEWSQEGVSATNH